MKILLASLIFLFAIPVFANEYESPYTRDDSPRVQEHDRINPDGNPANNYSPRDNRNPPDVGRDGPPNPNKPNNYRNR